MKILKISIASLIIFSCSNTEENESSNNGKGIVQNENAETISYDGQEREYILYVPSSIDESSPVPLMLNFHGGGGSASGQIYVSDMRPIADTANFILIYPQGSLLDNGGGTHWNSAPIGGDNKSSTDDFGFIKALIDKILLTHNVDTTRIYATGFSNGGDFSHSLPCFLSNKIAAAVSVAGLAINDLNMSCNPSHFTGIMIIHGTSDYSRPYTGISNYYSSVESTISFWRNFNNTTADVITNNFNINNNTIEHNIYNDSSSNSYVELYKVIGGEHYWLDITNNGYSTDQIIWNFVSKFKIQ